MDSKGEVLLTIMASLAQQESESLSANVRMGIQYRNQQGKVQINHNWFLGYTKDDEGNLVIDPEQAEIVRRIYREYLEGASFLQIKRSLEADGIPNGAGHLKWHESNIHQILPTKSTSAMPFCRRLTRSAFWTRSVPPTTVRCRSTMWKAAMKPLSTRMCS